MQFLKTSSPISDNELERETDFSEIQLQKVYFPIDFTELGIVISIREEQSVNASFPISTMDSGSGMVSMDLQPQNAASLVSIKKTQLSL